MPLPTGPARVVRKPRFYNGPMDSRAFPITPLLPAISDSLAAHPRLVLEAPPGAGKTTQLPLALLDAPWRDGRRIVMLEPRRVAARSAAGFMARQLGEEVGETVGYRIRFENKVSARTRIEVVTEGILTRMIQDDPLLEGVGALLFDEFHERHLSADLGLAMALDVQAQLREDLRIVVMSATLDGERLARFLDAPRLSSEGRSFPVQVAHFPARREESIEAQARRASEEAVARHPGDVLVFLPGQREIARVQAALEGGALPADVEVLALHGELPVEQQSRVLQPAPDGRRRVVLATNVAESSVTLPGVRVVIDAGLAREPRFDPNSGFSRLDAVAISQASADQRAGRAGRVAAGWAWRLWPESQRLEAQRRPEIAQVELAALALELAAWGSDALRFVDPPPPGALAAARELLRRLGALSDTGAITPVGKRMLALGTHPRLAAMLLAARTPREQALAADPGCAGRGTRSVAQPQRCAGRTLACAGCLPWRPGGARCQPVGTGRDRCGGKAVAPPPALRGRTAGRHRGARIRRPARPRLPRPDRRPAPAGPLRYQLANGRTAKLFDDSALRGEPWLVASELRFEARGDALLLRGAPVDETRLRADFADRFVEQEGATWDADKRALVARRESRFDRIVLDSRPAGRVDPKQAAQALTDAVRELGIDALPWTDTLRQWQARLVSLRTWMPELGLGRCLRRRAAGHARCVAAPGLRRQDPARCAVRGRAGRGTEITAGMEPAAAAARSLCAGADRRAFGHGTPHRLRARP